MKKTYLLGLSVAALFVVAGCSGTGTGGSNGNTGFITCTQASDCPSTEKTCAPLAGQSGNVCQCSTDAICGAGFVCNNINKQCQQKCTTDSNCQGGATAQKCDTATGQCVNATAPACDADGGAACPSGQVCDTTSHSCKAPTSCGTAETQGSCPYGQACFTPASGGTTTECEAVVNCTAGAQPTPTTGASPVVYDVTETGTRADTTGTCSGNGIVHQFAGHFYDPQNDVPETMPARYDSILIISNTSVPTAGNSQEKTTVNNTAGTFTFELCSDRNQKSPAVALKDAAGNISNSACIPAFAGP